MCVRNLITAVMSALGLSVSAADVFAQERYFVTVLAYQSDLNRPKLAHTFAVFTRATGDVKDPQKAKLENRTISWLPADLKVKVLRLRPEEGANLDLPKTLALAK